ncbi:helix-turn-helix transcriptional regulator [Curvivirga sp.]|uniref:helix-turn-helix transcriptional regulator n=1 Tax=Curvivirga sp. TaxID=2856848 RepID=UPI003B5C2E30
MRRADRLFEIIQILRSKNNVITAQDLAEELEISVRTVYRDIATLQGQKIPIEGEAGVGYILREGYDLPPLMFNIEELEALQLGARIVETWGDPTIAKAATNVLSKTSAVLPAELKKHLNNYVVAAPYTSRPVPIDVDLAKIRQWIREKRRLEFSYSTEEGKPSTRVIWPLSLAFYGPVWNIVGWCELRESFRAFRPDRMSEVVFHEIHYPDQPGRRLSDYAKLMKEECAHKIETSDATEQGGEIIFYPKLAS